MNLCTDNNLFVNHAGVAIWIQPHNDTPRTISVFYNTVVASINGIVLMKRENNPEYSQLVEGNVVFGAPPQSLPMCVSSGNVAKRYEVAGRYLNEPFDPLEKLYLYQLPGRLKKIPMYPRMLRGYEGWDRDFNGNCRKGLFAGAYGGEAHNPGWPLSRDRKP